MRGKRQYYIIYILLCCCLAFFAGIFVNRPVVADAASFASATLPEEVKSLFTDYTCTQLAAPTTLEEIATLKTKYSDATSTQYLSRAEQVILGHVKYTALREFSSQKNQIWQLGNLGNRLSSLNLRYPTSDLILTGIYGLTGQEIRVFVDANTNNLPQIIFTQNHGYWKGGYRSELTLQRGMNVFTYPTFVNSHIPENEIKGGAIYLKNNFNYAQQGDVKVYIEGGGFYPVFKKGEDENAFLDMLKEYEQKRLANQTSMLNLAELVTDHTIITTTSSSLYDNYIVNKTISPTINLELWGDFITQQLEFNGIATSPESHNNNWDEINNYININFRYMSVQPNSGAYTTNYHIGFYYEHDFFANFNTASVGDRNLFNMVHEVGHQIDTFRRKIDETTNNMNATYAYLMLLNKSPNSSWQPFDRSFEALSSDNSLNAEAFRDGHILYPATQINDRNYMLWWYLESVFPNFWADLNNIFRQDPATNLSDNNEKMVYYSSLVTGIDLSEYYERWGFFRDVDSNNRYTKFNRNNTSSTFKELMKNPNIKKEYTHFWLADRFEYNYIRNNLAVSEQQKQYSATPEIVSIQKSNSARTITISNKKSDSHLGYEIYVTTDNTNYKIAGFTYSNTFIDEFNYGSKKPTYKAIAVNRFFKTTAYSNTLSEGDAQTNIYACRIDNEKFFTLDEAVLLLRQNDAYRNKTIYLLNDCYINKADCYRQINIEVDPDVNNDITITGGDTYLFLFNGDDGTFNLKGNKNARIIIEGGQKNRTNGALYLASGYANLEYVTFNNCQSSSMGGAIYQQHCGVTLKNCQFVNCSSAKNNCALYFDNTADGKLLQISNCEFNNSNTDIYFSKNNFNLKFVDSVPTIKIDFPKLENEIYIECDNVLEQDLNKISFTDVSYNATIENGKIKISICSFNLKFNDAGTVYTTTINSKLFTFGSENLINFDNKKYIFSYYDVATGNSYSAGEQIEINSDKTFNIQVKNKIAINLIFMNENSTQYYAENEVVYLPLFDSAGNKIYKWTSASNSYFAGSNYTVTSADKLYADYLDYFKVQFLVGNTLQAVKYQTYGNQITTEACSLPGFKGWQADGVVVGANQPYTVTKDTLLVALIDDGKTYNLNDASIQILDLDFNFTGNQIKPRIKVTIDGEELPSYYYTIEYTQNINVGVATIKILPLLENVSGQKSTTFTITAKQLTETDVNISNIINPTYDGTIKTVNPTIIWAGVQLYLGSDYDIVYLNNQINAGLVNFNINFKGNYAGSIQKSFNILKAQKPNVNSNTIYVDFAAKTLKEITPPQNFVWVNENQAITSNSFTAAAKYVGSDAQNYEIKELTFNIIITAQQPDPPTPPTEPEEEPVITDNFNNAIIWIVVLVPITIIAGAWITFIIVRHKRNNWWKH